MTETKTILILGGTGNTGSGAAAYFSKQLGARVIITSRSQSRLDATIAEYGLPSWVVGVVADFSTDESAEAAGRAIDAAAGAHGIDHTINCLGFVEKSEGVSLCSAAELQAYLDRQVWPIFRGSRLILQRNMHREGATLTQVTAPIVHGPQAVTCGNGHRLWMNTVGQGIKNSLVLSMASEVQDKKGHLRVGSVCAHTPVPRLGATGDALTNQLGMPGAPDAATALAKAFLRVIEKNEVSNGAIFEAPNAKAMEAI